MAGREVAGSQLDDRRLRLLLDAGRVLVSELEHERVLQRLLDVARELTGARYAAIGVLDQGHSELARFITSGVDEETRRAIGDLPRGRGILGELIRHPEPLMLSRLSDHPRSYGLPPGHPRMTTFLGAPILTRGEAWGNIYLTDKVGGEFDDSDKEAVVILAEWAAIAIANARLYQDVEERRDELERAVRALEATTTIARALGGELELERVLELVAKRARALVEARSLLILLLDQDELEVVAIAGEPETATAGARLSVTSTVPGEVVRSGVPERLVDVGARLPLGLKKLTGDAYTALLVPLTFRGRTSGVLVALDRLVDGPEFTGEDERMLRAFATSAATAVATAKSIEADRLRHTIEAAELERGRWARELHDETLQALGALRIRLETALQGGDADRIGDTATKVAATLGEEIEKLQGLITELRPAALDDIGLKPALESLLQRAVAASGIEVRLVVDLDYAAGRHPTRLTPELERTSYRLVQEALNNVSKHARAGSAGVSVTESAGRVRIEVRDDGRGFDQTKVDGGFGLLGMRERVDLVGGSLELESTPGSGTVIRAELPARHRDDAPSRSKSA